MNQTLLRSMSGPNTILLLHQRQALTMALYNLQRPSSVPVGESSLLNLFTTHFCLLVSHPHFWRGQNLQKQVVMWGSMGGDNRLRCHGRNSNFRYAVAKGFLLILVW